MEPIEPLFQRAIDISLPRGQSAFLWGTRKAGKSTYLKARYPDALHFDLLGSTLRDELTRRPQQLREILDAAPATQLLLPIIIDEVQKVPDLLDEIHWLIENRGYSFILCGSSARKLKRGQANLLGGRAWRFEMFPLVSREVPGLDLLRALKHGLIPSHYLAPQPDRSLRSFVADYLKEEIAVEALTRRLGAFSRFIDVMGIMNGEMVNYAKIASDVGVDAKTVRSYFEILRDTMVGYFLEPLPAKAGSRKNLVATPKFYLFDTGIARTLRRVRIDALHGAEAGHLFETFISHEIRACLAYQERDTPVHFYRTKAHAEADFVLGEGETAIEVKLSAHVRGPDLRGLNSFLDEYPGARAIVVCLEERPRIATLGGRPVEVLPWRVFLAKLWNREI